ncbi:MAG: hypothetical protein SGI72_02260, partial [Planctomycetota bacterium]|nr:hypothetical protein [Planctomycetota bacterium]
AAAQLSGRSTQRSTASSSAVSVSLATFNVRVTAAFSCEVTLSSYSLAVKSNSAKRFSTFATSHGSVEAFNSNESALGCGTCGDPRGPGACGAT